MHVEGTEVAFLQKAERREWIAGRTSRMIEGRNQESDKNGILSHGTRLEPARNQGSFSPRGSGGAPERAR